MGEQPGIILSRHDHEGVLFDMDGVLPIRAPAPLPGRGCSTACCADARQPTGGSLRALRFIRLPHPCGRPPA